MDVEALADAVFVTSRERPPGVARRYPGLFGEGQVVAVEREGRVAGGLVIRPLRFPDFTASAIGLVAVAPEHRSRGVGGELLRLALDRIDGPCVLWARRHELYERAGFALHDDGVIGEAAGTAEPPRVAVAEPDPALLAPLRDPGVPERPAAWWGAIPFPAVAVRAAIAPGGYALFGVREDERFLYELCGDPASFEPLWQAVRAGCRRVTVNERRGSGPQAWLAGQGVRFEPQALALWRGAPGAPPYVPWLDRV